MAGGNILDDRVHHVRDVCISCSTDDLFLDKVRSTTKSAQTCSLDCVSILMYFVYTERNNWR